MKWYEEVLRRVPVTWSNQVKADFFTCAQAATLREDWLNLEVRPHRVKKAPAAAAGAVEALQPEQIQLSEPVGEGERREVTLTTMEIRWHDEDLTSADDA